MERWHLDDDEKLRHLFAAASRGLDAVRMNMRIIIR